MKPGFLRIALLLLCLTAGTAQAWVSQLHLHAHAAGAVAVAGDPVDEATSGQGEDDRACLLCQIVSHGSGAALAAAFPSVPVPLATPRESAPLARASPDSEPPSHHWLSRGPPRG